MTFEVMILTVSVIFQPPEITATIILTVILTLGLGIMKTQMLNGICGYGKMAFINNGCCGTLR